MEIKKEWEQIYLALPKKDRDKYYNYLEFLAHYLLENPTLRLVSCKEIEVASEGYISAKKLGSFLGKLATLEQVATYPNRKRVMKWKVEELKDVLYLDGLQAKNLDEIKESETEIKHEKYYIYPSNRQYIVENYKRMVMPSYSDPMLADIHSYFSKTYKGTDFIMMYHIVRRCIQMSKPRILHDNDIWYDKKDPHQFCLELPEVENDYPTITKKLLKHLYPNLPEFRDTVELLHSNRPHRLGCIVANPYKDWSKKKQNVEYTKQQEESFLQAHHICFNPRCINPMHISPLTVAEHRICHQDLDPDHYILNEHKDNLPDFDINSNYDADKIIPLREIADDRGFIIGTSIKYEPPPENPAKIPFASEPSPGETEILKFNVSVR